MVYTRRVKKILETALTAPSAAQLWLRAASFRMGDGSVFVERTEKREEASALPAACDAPRSGRPNTIFRFPLEFGRADPLLPILPSRCAGARSLPRTAAAAVLRLPGRRRGHLSGVGSVVSELIESVPCLRSVRIDTFDPVRGRGSVFGGIMEERCLSVGFEEFVNCALVESVWSVSFEKTAKYPLRKSVLRVTF